VDRRYVGGARGSDALFLRELREFLPERGAPVFRDLGREGMYWCPRQWEDRERLDAWVVEVAGALQNLASAHATHVMESGD